MAGFAQIYILLRVVGISQSLRTPEVTLEGSQAVSCWLPTAPARIRSRVWSSGIFGGQSGAEAGFLRVLRFPLPSFIPPNYPSS
jgi:hypothetical protein